MADVDEAIAATAVGLNEDAKAGRKSASKRTTPAKSLAEDAAAVAALGGGEETIVNDLSEGAVEDAIESLGAAVAAAPAESHETAIERMEANSTNATIDVRSLIPDVRDFILQTIKDRPKPWATTPKDEQADVAAACEHAATELVRKCVEAIRSGGAVAPIRCLLVGYSDKGDDIKIDMKLKVANPTDTTKAIVALHEAKGKHVLVTVASIEDYRADGREAELDEDQRGMNFEAGPIDDHPDDDSDLAAEDLEPDTDGDAGCRTNLKSGMRERLAADQAAGDEDAVWEEVREATPDELAAERERTADFGADD